MTRWLLVAALSVGAAFAQEAPPSQAPPTEAAAPSTEIRDGVIIRGKSEADAVRDSAAPVTVIDTTRARTQTADLGEVLARTEGVGIRRSGGLGSNTRLSLNGFSGDQVRIFVDGVPLEASGFGLGTGSIPLDFLDRIEIYQGVVPIQFGADALGGAVNLVTEHDIEGTGGSAAVQLGAFGTLRLTAGGHHTFPYGLYARAFGALDRADNDYPVQVQVADQEGQVREATVYRFNDAYAAAAGGVEVGVTDQAWAEQLMVRAFASRYSKEIQSNLTMQLPYGDVGSGNTAFGVLLHYDNHFFTERLGVRADAGYGQSDTEFQDEGMFVYDWFGQPGAPRAGSGEISARGTDRENLSTITYLRLGGRWAFNEAHAVEVAVAPTYTTRQGKERNLQTDTFDTLGIERGLTTLNSGLAYELKLFERVENTAFVKLYYYTAHTLAGTFTMGTLTNGAYVERTFNHSSLGFGDMARVRLIGGLFAKGSFESATRLPRPDELFGDNIFIEANNDLQPETSQNYNLGLQLESGKTPAGRFDAEVNGFLRQAEGLIVLLGSSDYELRYQNLVDATSKGVQGSTRWTSPGRTFLLGANATWMDYRNASKSGYFSTFDDERIPNTPYLFANGEARITLRGVFAGGDDLSLDWHGRYVHEFFRAWENIGIKSTKQTIPEQITHSLGLVYAVGNDEQRFVSTIECANLTDEKTFDFFGQQRPGRAVYWKGTIEFF